MKKIKIVDSHYRFLCEVDDGKMLKVWKPGKESESMIRPCRYLDEYHFQYGGRTFHICQFGEWLENGGYQAKPLGYFLDYKKYPMERFFGSDYYRLDRYRQASFFYSPKAEYPFMVYPSDESGGDRRGIPYIGDSLIETVGYDADGANWGLDFNMEKIKNIVYLSLPQMVLDAEKVELAAQKDLWKTITACFAASYQEGYITSFEEMQRSVEEAYGEGHRGDLLPEEELKSKYMGMVQDSHKVFINKNFEYCDFSGIDLAGYTFICCNLSGCMLENTNMDNVKMLDCNLPIGFPEGRQVRKENGRKPR